MNHCFVLHSGKQVQRFRQETPFRCRQATRRKERGRSKEEGIIRYQERDTVSDYTTKSNGHFILEDAVCG